MRQRRGWRALRTAAAPMALAAALAGCTTAMDRYRALPADEREAYERCAQQRCGPAPQWRGEASWALRQWERERLAHAACWDGYLSEYVELPDRERRRLWLVSRCNRLPPPAPLPMDLR